MRTERPRELGAMQRDPAPLPGGRRVLAGWVPEPRAWLHFGGRNGSWKDSAGIYYAQHKPPLFSII